MSGNVFGGDVTASLSRTAALEQVMREETDVRPNALGIDLLHGHEGSARQSHGISRRSGVLARGLRRGKS